MSADAALAERLADALKRHCVPGASLAVCAGGSLRKAAAGVVDARTGVEATPHARGRPRPLRFAGRVHRRVV